MLKRRYLVVIVLLAVAVFVVRQRSKHDGSAPPAALAGLERAAQAEAAKRLERLPPLPGGPRRDVGRFSAELIRSIEERFRSMAAVRGLITQEKERRALSQQILAMPGGADLMRELLLNPSFARDAFATYQAESRFYAITVLDEAARTGNVSLAVNTTADLAQQLSAAGGEPDRGRAEDLMGIAAVVGRSGGSHALQDSKSPLVAQLGLASEMPKQVRALCLRGLFLGVWRAETLENAQAVIERLRTL